MHKPPLSNYVLQSPRSSHTPKKSILENVSPSALVAPDTCSSKCNKTPPDAVWRGFSKRSVVLFKLYTKQPLENLGASESKGLIEATDPEIDLTEAVALFKKRTSYNVYFDSTLLKFCARLLLRLMLLQKRYTIVKFLYE